MVVVVGAAVFLLTFDPNAYKYKLSEVVLARYDRTLTIAGELELSLLPRLGLNVQAVSLSEAGQPDDEFVSVDEARVAVAIWPLLFNKLVVDHVAIDGFRARVVRDTEGRFNFQNLIDGDLLAPPASGGHSQTGIQTRADPAADAETAPARTQMSIDIAGLELRGGELFLHDASSASQVRIVGLDARTGRITFDQPFTMNVSTRTEGETPIDVSALAGVTANGTLKVGKLHVRGLQASEVSAAIKVENGRLDVSNLAATFYQGKLAGVLFLDSAKGNALGAKLSLAGVSLDPLLTGLTGNSRLRGKGSLAVDLNTAGDTPTAWRHALSGTVQARLRDGAVKGINVAQTLRELKTVFGGSRASGAQPVKSALETDFSELDADLSFAKGVGTVRKFNMTSPLLRLSQGSPAIVNVANNTLNLVVNVRVVNTSTGQGGKDLDVLKGITLPIHLAGPFEKPVYGITWSKVGGELDRRALEKRLKDAILGGAGGGSSGDRAVRDIGRALKGMLNP